MNLPSDNLECEVANSIDFMVERVSQSKDPTFVGFPAVGYTLANLYCKE